MKSSPTYIDERNWCYDETSGLLMVHEVIKAGVVIQTDQFTVPWQVLRAALARKDHQKQRQRQRETMSA